MDNSRKILMFIMTIKRIMSMNENNQNLSLNRTRFYLILTAIGYSTAGVAFKLVSWHPMVIGAIRGIIAIICHSLYLGSMKVEFNKSTWMGALLAYGCTTSFIIANKLTTASNAIVLQYTNPIFIVLISYFVLKQNMRKKDIFMVAMIISGIFLFFLDELTPGYFIGNMFALLSGILMAILTIYGKHTKVNVQHYYMISNMIAIIIGIPFIRLNPPVITLHSILGIIILGIVALAIPQILFTRAIKYTTPIEASILLMLDPILNPLLVVLFIGEWPGFWAIIGGSIVIIGVILWCVIDIKKNQNMTLRKVD